MVYGSRPAENSEVQKVVSAVNRWSDLRGAVLSEEFFPAHLTAALIDAVLNSPMRYDLVCRPGKR